MFSINDVKNHLQIAYNTAKQMILDIAETGSTNVLVYKKTIGVFDLNLFIQEVNNLKRSELCRKKQNSLEKEATHTLLTLQSMEEEYASQLARLL